MDAFALLLPAGKGQGEGTILPERKQRQLTQEHAS